MPKTIESPVKKFPGSVTLPDYLTFPQSFKVEEAIEAVQVLGEEPSMKRLIYAWLPALISVVELWNIQGLPVELTPDTFPSTPPVSVANLMAWLIGEITTQYSEPEESDPNA